MAKCAKCGHWLHIHEVEEFSTSRDDNMHPHYGVTCKFEFTPTHRCGCNAGFDYDVIVERRLRLDTEKNPQYCQKCGVPAEKLNSEWITLPDHTGKPIKRVWSICDRCYTDYLAKH